MLEPILSLTFLEGSEPLNYGLSIRIDSLTFGNVLLHSHQNIPEEPDNNNTFVVLVNAVDNNSGSEELIINLGAISLNPDSGVIEVVLVDDQNQIIGKNKVRAEEAQKESRPIDFK